MACLLDTNILVRLVHEDDPYRVTVVGAVERLSEEKEWLCFAPQNAIELWNVATRPAEANGLGLASSAADEMLRLLEALYPCLPVTSAVYERWRNLVVKARVHGVLSHDAHIVACMVENGVDRILTRNTKDFNRFMSFAPIRVDSPESIIGEEAV